MSFTANSILDLSATESKLRLSTTTLNESLLESLHESINKEPTRDESGQELAEPELTVRTVIVGSLIGCVICVSNLYFGFKTGMTLGGSITGAILGFVVMEVLLPRSWTAGFGRKELCTLSSVCNAAGGFSGGFITAIPALMWYGKDFKVLPLMLWTLSAGSLGVFYMIPLRRHMIINQQLAFPSGTATAVLIDEMCQAREKGLRKAMLLLWTMFGAFAFVVASYFLPVLYSVPVFYWVGLPAAQAAGFFLNLSPAMIGSGYMSGMRVSLSMFVAALIGYGVLGPLYLCRGVNHAGTIDAFTMGCHGGGLLAEHTSGPPFLVMRGWLLWVSITVIFADQVVSLLMQYRSIAAAFTSQESAEDPASADQIPSVKVWGSGMALSSVFTVVVVTIWFGMKWWEVVVAVVFGVFLSIICIQCTGETDTTPTGAVGKMSQLMFAGLSPHQPVPNLMAANIAAAGSTQAVDIMQAFKAGHILRASPKSQYYGSILGSVAGVFVSVAGWYMFKPLIPQCPETSCLEAAPNFPAQAAQVWYAAAKVLAEGFDALPHGVMPFAIGGLVYGAVMALAQRLAPAYARWTPSSSGVSLGLLLGPYIPLSMLIGCAVFTALEKRFKNDDKAKTVLVVVTAGMIAGEGMAGIMQAALGVANIPQGQIGCYGGFPC